MFKNEKEFTVYFSMTGSVTIYASNREEAEEILLSDYSKIELAGNVE